MGHFSAGDGSLTYLTDLPCKLAAPVASQRRSLDALEGMQLAAMSAKTMDAMLVPILCPELSKAMHSD